MNALAHLAMLGWIPVVLLLFSQLPPRRAAIAAFLLAWLFLPAAHYEIPMLPDYTKMSATSAGVLLGAFLFDNQRLLSFRLTAVDLPMACWCVAPFISSMANGLGLWDATAALFNQIVIWGLPYLIGRIYLGSVEGLRELALGIVIGGLVYVPFCLWESRMSPQLHNMLYGFMAHSDFSQTHRLGGWRPMVFMEHGLMVGAWMMSATLTGLWLYSGKALEAFKRYHPGALLAVLAFSAVWVRSLGALLLLLVGLSVLFLSHRFRTSALFIFLILTPPTYMAMNVAGVWSGGTAVDIVATAFPKRAASLQFRFDNEHILVDKALQRPLFGWGGWGRARVYDERGEDISTTDGLWIITLGNYGLFGLAAMVAVFLVPAVGFVSRHPFATRREPESRHLAAVVMLLVLYAIDNLLNAMVNPIYVLAAGGATGLMLLPRKVIQEKVDRATAFIGDRYHIRFLTTEDGDLRPPDILQESRTGMDVGSTEAGGESVLPSRSQPGAKKKT